MQYFCLALSLHFFFTKIYFNPISISINTRSFKCYPLIHALSFYFKSTFLNWTVNAFQSSPLSSSPLPGLHSCICGGKGVASPGRQQHPLAMAVHIACNGYIINYIIDKLSFPSYLFILRHFSLSLSLSLFLFRCVAAFYCYCYCCCLFIHFLAVQQQLQQWRQMFYSR